MATTYPARCPTRQANGRMCAQKAGHGTNHPGFGRCRGHGGGQRHVEEVWAMAEEMAAEYDVTPQEALLGFVRVSAARSAYLDMVVREKLRRHVEGGGDPFEPPDGLVPWLRQSRDERTAATRTAKSAVDAGVMAALEKRLDLEGELVADTLGAVLDALDLSHDQRMYALATAQAKLAGEPLPEAPVSAAAVVEEPVDPQAGMEQRLRELTADEPDVDVDALLAEVDEEEGRDG